jgi:F0F1-type ATP synthase membrane subunit c/vacuolar-type H+-ATPase subunit K
VFLSVTILGFVKNGIGFLGMFWVTSAPLALRPILAVIEVISYFVRPVSHSIRLAGNLMAGHAVIKVFAGFAGRWACGGVAVVAIGGDCRDLRAGAAGGGHPGLRLHHPDLRVSARRCRRGASLGSGQRTNPFQFHKERRYGRRYRRNGQIHRCRPGTIGLGGAGIGVGHVAGNFLAGALRNPSAAPGQMANLFVGIAFAEALGIFSFLVALLLMFAV